MTQRLPVVLLTLAALAALAACRSGAVAPAADGGARWWKGNTHTHTLWSDGDDFPDMVADWYRRNGYHFLAITDHNTLAADERWWRVPASGIGREAYEKYRARFGDRVEERRSGDTLRVRLRRLAEYGPELEQPGRFLLVPGEEVTQYLAGRGAHLNALNVAEVIAEQPGATLVDILRRDVAQVRAQERRVGRPMAAVLNHPNFLWSQTAADLLALPELRFFEVYNGHPLVHVQGDSVHASTERMWDIVLTRRRAAGGALLYGVATDDAHDYHRTAPQQRNGGRGWIVVRAPRLHADSLLAAMGRGDFYASTGVELADLRRDGRRVSIAVRAEPGVRYTIQFVGTRRGWDTTSTAVTDSAGTRGATATYELRGDELYVRARVTSSRAKANPSYLGEMETAWTQPWVP